MFNYLYKSSFHAIICSNVTWITWILANFAERENMGILEFILKIVVVIAVSVVAYRMVQPPANVLDDAHPILALILELGAIYFIFF